ncbi:GAF and ANTAR domain-containing protein [Haloactinopolyspora alba]|nr:GAF and ANTAR domain-containing protein [Haloactinopolyspora alba]
MLANHQRLRHAPTHRRADPPAGSRWLADVYDSLADGDSLAGFLTELARRVPAAAWVGGSCAINLAAAARWEAAHAGSDDYAIGLDFVQHSVGEGPSVEVLDIGSSARIPDLASERRWPTFTIPARLDGLGSLLAVPLTLRSGTTAGVLTMYSTSSHAYSDDDLRRLSLLSAELPAALAVALRLAEQRHHAAGLRHAMTTRATIGQATGILMARHNCTQDAAFARLRDESRRRNRKLRELAADTVEGVSGQRPEVQAAHHPTD